MQIEEVWTNETENYICSEPIRHSAEDMTPGQIFRAYQSDGWRCQSSVYIGEEKPKRIGWFFVRSAKYEDTGERYLQGLWLTLIDSIEPAKVHYKAI